MWASASKARKAERLCFFGKRAGWQKTDVYEASALVGGNKITGPALIVTSVRDNKAKEYRNLKQIWTKVQEKPEFLNYVQSNIQSYLK